jgi:hypothetical protein
MYSVDRKDKVIELKSWRCYFWKIILSSRE